MKATSFNPYEPPQEIRTSPQPGDHRSWYRDAVVYGLPLEFVFSSIGLVVLLLIGVPLINALIETQACILVIFGSVSALLLLLFGERSTPFRVTTSVCVIAGWIVIVCCVVLAGNLLRLGIFDEQTTFYRRASGQVGMWHWPIPIIAVGVFPSLLGLSLVRTSLKLALPVLLMTVLSAAIYAWFTTYTSHYLWSIR